MITVSTTGAACMPCRMTKQVMSSAGIQFTDVDLTSPENAPATPTSQMTSGTRRHRLSSLMRTTTGPGSDPTSSIGLSEASGATTPDDESHEERLERRTEQVRAYKAEYRRAHAAEIAAYRAKHNADHRQELTAHQREYTRRVQAKRRAERAEQEAEEKREAIRLERAEARSRKARADYAKDPQRVLDRQREYRVKRQQADPEQYRSVRREALKRWRDNHKEEQNAKERERYDANAVERTARMREYYAANAPSILTRKKEKWAADPEGSREQQRRRRAVDVHRPENGLPRWRVRRTSAEELRANDLAASDYFHREFSADQIEQMRVGPPTPRELIDAWKRDSARARARSYYSIPLGDRAQDPTDRVAADQIRDRLRRRLDAERNRAEIERLDAIGRQVNDRLRYTPRRGARAPDPAAPHWAGGLGSSPGLLP